MNKTTNDLSQIYYTDNSIILNTEENTISTKVILCFLKIYWK